MFDGLLNQYFDDESKRILIEIYSYISSILNSIKGRELTTLFIKKIHNVMYSVDYIFEIVMFLIKFAYIECLTMSKRIVELFILLIIYNIFLTKYEL